MGRPTTPPPTPGGEDISTPRKLAAAIDLASERTPRGTKYKHKALERLSAKHGISKRELQRIGAKTRQQLNAGTGIDLSHRRMGREPTTTKFSPEVAQKIRRINKATKGRGSFRQIQAKLNAEGVDVASPSTVMEWTKNLDAFKTRNSVLPILTRDQKIWRVDFSLNKLKANGECKAFYDEVHIDEKWFALMPDGELIRVIPNADGTITMPEPPKAQHKNAIPKVMFVAANARPRPEYGFDGKIGMWRVTSFKTAQRGSKNHDRGDVYEVDISINAAVYRQLLQNKVLPAIRRKMWWKRLNNGHEAGPIILQQDGATPHTARDNEDFFQRERYKGGFDIQVITQPAQSPDLNLNDCSFFRSIHTTVRITAYTNLDELAARVLEAYAAFSAEKLEHCWQVVQRNILHIIRQKGENNYKNIKTHERTRRRHGGDMPRLTREERREAQRFVDTID